MGFFRLIYFSALSGALAGLIAWGISAVIGAVLETGSAGWFADALILLVFAISLAPFLLVQLDRFSGRTFRWATFGAGILIAIISAFVAILYCGFSAFMWPKIHLCCTG